MAMNRGFVILPDGSGNGTTPINARLGMAGLVADDGSGALGIRQGVFWDGVATNVVIGNTDTGTMSYSVRAFQAAWYLLGTAASGVVIAANDAVFKATTTAAPGSNSRIDVIYVRHHATASDGGSDTDTICELKVVQGTPAASPTAPTVPTGGYALASVVVPAGTTNTNALTFTQLHTWTTTHGSPIPVRNTTERGALTPYSGMSVYRLDNQSLEIYDGTLWNPILNKPRRRLQRTTTFSVAANSLTAVGGWAAASGDDGDGTGFSLSSNTITCDRAGWVHVQMQMQFGAASSGNYQVMCYRNITSAGPPVTGGTQEGYVSNPANASQNTGFLLDCYVLVAAADTLTFVIQQTSGGAVTCGSSLVGNVIWNLIREDDA